MVEEKINQLKSKLDTQIKKEDKYANIYKTSAELDRLIVEYYRKMGLSGVK